MSINCPTCHGTGIIEPDPEAARHLRDLGKAIGAICSQGLCPRKTESRGLCNAHYKALRRREQRRARVIEDVEWILGTDSPENIAHRLGFRSARILARTLYRWGRPDLGVMFDRREVAA